MQKKKYKCDHCRKKFKTEIFLKKRIKVLHHQGRKNYCCFECGKDFDVAQHLKKHIEFVQGGGTITVQNVVKNLFMPTV